ncbi:MAG: RICIN domain-containing protein [Ferruginibacter sp.]|nr:RICIN domain-containing protein [Ferruginibacter sp.]
MNKLFFSMMLICLLGCKKDGKVGTTVEPAINPVVASSDTVTTSTKNFKGVNWADPRDNFADDWLILSGLNAMDDETVMKEKAGKILSALQAKGINTVRFPVNPATVLQTWWPRYSSVISAAAGKGMKVILAYWEGASSKDGIVDNTATFWLMWTNVLANFSNNGNIYFEVFNEPHGYSVSDLKTLYAEFLTRFPALPKRRVILDGVGYATDVNSIGSDNRFNGCLLSFHFYSWFANSKTTADWELPLRSINHPERTITTEFGVPMTNGKNYLEHPGSDAEITYFQGMTNQLHELGMGSMYWPGLRAGDSYSMFSLNGTSLDVNNTSGFTRLQYAWGTGSVDPLYASFQPGTFQRIVNRNSEKTLDVNGSATTNGANIIQWDYLAQQNQQWAIMADGDGWFKIINRNSNKALEVSEGSNVAGTSITQWDYSGRANQQWQITDIGFGYYKIINKNSELALDVNGGSVSNGGNIIQWHWNNGANQQWKIALQ